MKDFKSWMVKKENIHRINSRPYHHEREIWYCHLGTNVGSEQDGKGKDFLRPIVIIKKFNTEIFLSCPLTSAIKNSKFYFAVDFKGKKSSVILSQIRLTDSKRLSHKIGTVSKDQFQEAIKKLKALLP